MTYHYNDNKACYFPPLLSNGEISFAPDAEGMLGYTMAEYKERGMHAFDGIVVRVARRSAPCRDLQTRLFPFGSFTFHQGSPLADWSQTLRVEKGVFESDCRYADGAVIHSEGFIHPYRNLYALQKSFMNLSGETTMSYRIDLSGYNPAISRYMTVLYVKEVDGICAIGFRMYGIDVFTGEIRIFLDKPFTVTPHPTGATLTFQATEGESLTFYYLVEDDWHGTNFSATLDILRSEVDTLGFAGLKEGCEAHFSNFYALGYVKSADKDLNRIYQTSLYSVKCNTTPYSIAVGFNNGSWDGRYFSFDEYTSYLGLLGANRHELAKRVPTYRLTQCLPTAIQRASDCHRNAETEDMARFHWETGEIDRTELAPPGNWLDHIFHMPLVGIGAFNYFEYTQDRDFLAECYPMIRACAKFITKHMVYRDGERLYIGKCTDLERLGSSVENPFMTSCGAIKLLRCTAKAADILGIDTEYAKTCETVADGLFASLPTEGDMYVPFLGCKQKSIAVYAGKFPFDLLPDDDSKQLAAWEDFEINGGPYGNMYPTGSGISPWYACWKAEAYARAKLPEKAYASLRQAYPSAGVFGEMFEINEAHVRMRPWFATAAGIFLSAVNDMLLQIKDDTVHILPGFPHTLDVAFKLAGKGGLIVEAEVQEGRLRRILLTKDGTDVTGNYKVIF